MFRKLREMKYHLKVTFGYHQLTREHKIKVNFNKKLENQEWNIECFFENKNF